jgi:hypothetical protein
MSRSAWCAWLCVAALAFALRAPVAGISLERDEGEYAYIAQRWAQGDVPYRDVFDQKPPAIFAFYALAFSIGGESVPALRWAAQTWLVAGLAALALAGARLLSARTGVAAAAFAALMLADPSFNGNAVNTEMLAFTPLAFGALALLFKPVVAPIVLFQAATFVLQRHRRFAHAAAGTLGGLLVVVPIAAFFVAAGAWSEFLDATLWNNLAYAGFVPLRLYPIAFWRGISASLVPFTPIYALAAAGGALATFGRDPRASGALRWLMGWLALSVPAIAAGGYFREHYFLLGVPPLALLAAASVDWATRRIARRPRIAVASLVACVVAVFAYVVLQQAWYYGHGSDSEKLVRIYGRNPFPEAPRVASWLAAHAKPDDRVFVYGSEPQLLFYSGLRSASRYIFTYPLNMPYGSAAERQREVLAELEATPPHWLVVISFNGSQNWQRGTPPKLRRGIDELLARDYRLAALVFFDEQRSGSLIEGEAARASWNLRSIPPGIPPVAYAVWERRTGETPGGRQYRPRGGGRRRGRSRGPCRKRQRADPRRRRRSAHARSRGLARMWMRRSRGGRAGSPSTWRARSSRPGPAWRPWWPRCSRHCRSQGMRWRGCRRRQRPLRRQKCALTMRAAPTERARLLGSGTSTSARRPMAWTGTPQMCAGRRPSTRKRQTCARPTRGESDADPARLPAARPCATSTITTSCSLGGRQR